MSSQSDIAYEKIKTMIFHMELVPGDKISELQLSAKLEISRTPIHDALRKLAAEGLVTLGRNRSATVAEFSDEEIQEIGTLRLSQDILSARLAAYHGSAADFEQLYLQADACENAAEKGDIYLRIKADNDFHLAISKVSGNELLYRQQYALYQQIHLIQISKYTDIEDSLVQIHHHNPIIHAISSGELDEASKLICEHVKDFYHIDPYLMKYYGYTPDMQEQ